MLRDTTITEDLNFLSVGPIMANKVPPRSNWPLLAVDVLPYSGLISRGFRTKEKKNFSASLIPW
jgi:hypothetical protein